MHLVIWFFTLALLGLWTLTAWALSHLLGAAAAAWVGQLGPWLAKMPFGGWLEGWFPQWLQVAQTALVALQQLLGWLGGALPVVVWLVWGVGTLLLVMAGVALSLVVALVRRSMPPKQPPAAPPMAAA